MAVDALQFTKIGETMPETMKWIFFGLSAVAAAVSIIPKYRKGGRFLALGFALIPFSQLPITYLPFVAVGLRLIYLRNVRRKLSRCDVLYGVLSMALLGGLSIYMGTGKEISASGTNLSCVQWRFGSNSTRVDGLKVTEKAGWDGQVDEWRFDHVPSKTAEDAFVANVWEGELYWDHAGHVLSAAQVALELQTWSHVTPVRENALGLVVERR